MVYGRTEAEALAKQHQAENGGTGTRHAMSDLPPETRARPVRITVDLDGPRYDRLRRWVNDAANTVNPDRGRLSLAAGIRALIDATADETVTLVATDLLRHADHPTQGSSALPGRRPRSSSRIRARTSCN
jgi:hypothetical protein